MAQTHHYLFDTANQYNDVTGSLDFTNVSGSIDATGKINQCYAFTFSGSLSASTANNLLPASGAFTLAFWIKATTAQYAATLFEVGNAVFSIYGKTFEFSAAQGVNSWYIASFSPSTFTHLIISYNGSGTWTVYVNNVSATILNTQWTPDATTYDSSSPFYIGYGPSDSSIFIDDLRIYDGVIDGTERSRIYNSGAGTQNESGGSVTATYTKFNPFIEAVMEKVHNLSSDQLKIALTNTAPLTSNSVLADLTEISYTNLSSRNVTTSSSSQTSGTYKLVCADLTLTATGSVGPFRYIVLYNDTATSKNLIAYYDYGSSITMQNGDNLAIDFDGSNGVFTAS